MKKLILGYAFLTAAVLFGISCLPGCTNSPSTPAPVTVTTPLCTGTAGFAYFGSSNTAFFNFIDAGGVSIASASPVTAYNIGLYILNTSTPGLIRGAIYAGTTSGPTTLLAESAPQSLVLDAWNGIPVPSTTLIPGRYYWLAFQAQATNTYFQSDLSSTSGNSFQSTATYTFGSFPSSMPAGTVGGFPDNFYVNYCP